MLKPPPTHIVALIDDTRSPLAREHVLRTSTVTALPYAQNLAHAWRTESTNIHHVVLIAQVVEIHELEVTPVVTLTPITQSPNPTN